MQPAFPRHSRWTPLVAKPDRQHQARRLAAQLSIVSGIRRRNRQATVRALERCCDGLSIAVLNLGVSRQASCPHRPQAWLAPLSARFRQRLARKPGFPSNLARAGANRRPLPPGFARSAAEAIRPSAKPPLRAQPVRCAGDAGRCASGVSLRIAMPSLHRPEPRRSAKPDRTPGCGRLPATRARTVGHSVASAQAQRPSGLLRSPRVAHRNAHPTPAPAMQRRARV